MARRDDQVRVAQLDPNADFRGPFRELTSDQRRAWDDVVAACPEGVLRACDEIFVDCVASQLASWRRQHVHTLGAVLLMYRMLAALLVPMLERRRLLFPDRPKRRHLQ